jgi:hypothetical protein
MLFYLRLTLADVELTCKIKELNAIFITIITDIYSTIISATTTIVTTTATTTITMFLNCRYARIIMNSSNMASLSIQERIFQPIFHDK